MASLKKSYPFLKRSGINRHIKIYAQTTSRTRLKYNLFLLPAEIIIIIKSTVSERDK